VISVKPSVARWDSWPQAVRTNELLEAIAEKNDRVKYVDVATPMLKPDGTVMTDIFVEDDLHLNEKGYAIWAAAVRAVLVPAEAGHEPTDR
jgi:lysophospholipase L1-like esterase